MELKIEHLSAYLPYGLTFLMESEPDSKEPNIDELKSIDVGLKMVNFGWGNAKTLTEIKPILKPKVYLHKLQDEMLIRWGGGLTEKAKGKWIKDMTDNMLYSDFTALRYDEVHFMLENHIDVFCLINAGLATGCTETKEMQSTAERGGGCHECGYKGRVRNVVPVPAFMPDGSIVKVVPQNGR